jgi:molybdopterin/thiamine biosynthesis adenylyltransferase
MFSRNVLAFGQEGQRQLSQLCVGVVGASGTGSHVCEQLIRLGVGKLIVIDPDRVGTENLNRMVTAFRADARWRRFKPKVIARYSKKVSGPTFVTPVQKDILDPDVAQLLFGADALFACTDTVSSRAVLNRIAIQRFTPLWDCGTEISGIDHNRLRAFARVRTVFAGSACLLCMGVIDPNQLRIETLLPAERERERKLGYIRDADVPAPAVVSLNGVAASLAVMRFLEWAVGEEPIDPGQWVYRSFAGDVRSVAAERREDCPVCGVDGRLGRVDLDVQL